MRLFRFSALCCAALAAVSLTACDVTTPSHLETSQIRVQDVTKTALLPAGGVDSAMVSIAANDYARNGRGKVRLVVPYLKGTPLNRMAAQRAGEGYRRAFREHGIDVAVNYAETVKKDDARNAVLSYTGTVALPPRSCMRMTGSDGAETMVAGEKYSVGCSMKTAMSQMIANPDDLMGVAGTPDEVARRQGPMMENYMSGKTNAPLNGLNASATGTTSVTGGGVSAGQPTSK